MVFWSQGMYLAPIVTIAFDAKRYFNNASGLGFYSRTLLDGLRYYYPEHHYLLYTPYNKDRLQAPTDGIRLPNTWLGRQFHPLWRSRGMTTQVKRDGATVFHGLSHELPIGLKRAGIPSVVSMHDLIFLRFPALYPAFDRFFYEKKYRRAAHAADVVVAISTQTRNDLVDFFQVPSEKIKIIGQSCDAVFERLSLRHLPDREALSLPEYSNLPAKDYLISVGSLTPRKNWHTLLQAMVILKKEGIEIPLVAVGAGKGPYAQQIRQQAAQNHLRVHWLDHHVPTAELAGLYRRAATMVYPSIFEGFGIPILEALTVGLPVVTTHGGCFEEVAGQAALYAPPDDAEALAAQIARSLDSQVRTQLLVRIPEQILPFSPERICGEWIGVYRRLAKELGA